MLKKLNLLQLQGPDKNNDKTEALAQLSSHQVD